MAFEEALSVPCTTVNVLVNLIDQLQSMLYIQVAFDCCGKGEDVIADGSIESITAFSIAAFVIQGYGTRICSLADVV